MSSIKEIRVDSYEHLTSSATEMLSTMQTMNDDIESNDKNVRDVFTDSSFKGPVVNYLSNLWDSVNKSAMNNTSRLGQNAAILTQINSNYVESDKKASDGIEAIQK